MTVLPAQPWPDGETGKVLLHFVANCSVDSLFEDFFGTYPELQAKLHKQRNDTNCAESPWVSQRSELPGQQFVWPAPPAGADPGTPGQGKCRKVKFEAAASLASKAFSSEEVQTILDYAPGSHYLVESEVYTTAMYGDQFCIISRTSLVARGASKAQVHLVYAINFKPSLSRLMKPMVAKGVDGGIRGTFGLLKRLLQEQYTLIDMPDAAPPPELPGAGAAVAAAAANPAAAEFAAAPAAATTAAMPVPSAAPALFGLADYIVYQELVASILQMSDPSVIAKGLAMCLTLALIHVIITVVRPISQVCSAAAAAAAASGSSGGLSGLLCWPLVSVIDIPDNVTEVLGALLLVALANRLLVLGVEVASGWMSAPVSSRVASSVPAAAAAAAASGAALANGSAESSTVLQGEAAVDGGAVVGTAGSGATRRPAAAKGKQQEQQAAAGRVSPKGMSAPVPIPGRSSPAAAAGSGGGVGSGDGLMQNLGSVMSGWGRTLLGGNMVDSLASNEGLKMLMGGSWPRTSSNAALTGAPPEGQAYHNQPGPGTGAAAATANGSSTSNGGAPAAAGSATPGRALSHRHTTSFTAVMDPSGLNIIEDYAQLSDMLPRLPEEQQQQRGSPAASAAASPATAAQPLSSAAAAPEPAPAPAAAGGGPPGSPAGSSAASSPAASSPASSRSASPTKPAAAGSRLSLAGAAVPAAAKLTAKAAAKQVLNSAGSTTDDGSRQPLLAPAAAAGGGDEDEGEQAAGFGGNTTAVNSSRAATPTPTSARSPARPRSSSKAVSFNHAPGGPEKAAGSFSVGSAGSRGSEGMGPLARRSASPMLFGGGGGDAGGGSSGSLGSRPSSSSKLRAQGDAVGEGVPGYEALAGGSAGVWVVPGEEEEDEVVVEVFEHERVQPFRGWGHTWPGHFLPSDKVGHWGDRSGGPGGAMSMLFDRVAPKLPIGWTWQDDEWRVDMTGEAVEGCDGEGWAYGMDFSWLTWPPAPQMGKAGIKSFVRRRRWVRTRVRLPPGSYDAEALLRQSSLMALQEMGSGGGDGGIGAARSASATSVDGGLMAGLGSGLGGLVGSDGSAAAAATAAAAAASAMMSRFMRAVTDLPSPTGSGGGAPPAASSSPTAAAGSSVSASAAVLGSPPGQQALASASSAPSRLPVPAALAESDTIVAAAIAGPVSSSSSSHAGEEAGESGNDTDDDSSSVDSDTPPPRPQFPPHLEDMAAGPAARAGSGLLQSPVMQQAERSARPAGKQAAGEGLSPRAAPGAEAADTDSAGITAAPSDADTDPELSTPMDPAVPAVAAYPPAAASTSSSQREPPPGTSWPQQVTAGEGAAGPASTAAAAGSSNVEGPGTSAAAAGAAAAQPESQHDAAETSSPAVAPPPASEGVQAATAAGGTDASGSDVTDIAGAGAGAGVQLCAVVSEGSEWVWSSAEATPTSAQQASSTEHSSRQGDASTSSPAQQETAAAALAAAAASMDKQHDGSRGGPVQIEDKPAPAAAAVPETAAPAAAAAAAGVPVGVPVTSLKRLGSVGSGGSSSLSQGGPAAHSPRVGTGRGLRPRPSNGGGRRGRGSKLGAVSMRNSADGMLQSSGGSGALSPTGSGAMTPTSGVTSAFAAAQPAPEAAADGGGSPAELAAAGSSSRLGAGVGTAAGSSAGECASVGAADVCGSSSQEHVDVQQRQQPAKSPAEPAVGSRETVDSPAGAATTMVAAAAGEAAVAAEEAGPAEGAAGSAAGDELGSGLAWGSSSGPDSSPTPADAPYSGGSKSGQAGRVLEGRQDEK